MISPSAGIHPLALLALILCALLCAAPLLPPSVPQDCTDARDAGLPIDSGRYVCPNDGSTLTIAPTENGAFLVEISLYRLTLQECTAAYVDGVFTVTATDAAGNPMIWEITRSSEGLCAEVHSSTWSLLPEGTVIEFIPESP